MTALRKVQDLASRIDRLGRYAGALDGFHVEKSKGVMALQRGVVFRDTVMCEPRTGRVWLHESGKDGADLCAEHAVKCLEKYEQGILAQAQAKAREEVLDELVARKLRRITRAKSRRFKVNQKKA